LLHYRDLLELYFFQRSSYTSGNLARIHFAFIFKYAIEQISLRVSKITGPFHTVYPRVKVYFVAYPDHLSTYHRNGIVLFFETMGCRAWATPYKLFIQSRDLN